ncbi:MAG: hypothetical protein H6739_11385 [Alphaproteobacteria bacterium]|nr:hypothetical protein [Alphaproteobacteria bacterium]
MLAWIALLPAVFAAELSLGIGYAQASYIEGAGAGAQKLVEIGALRRWEPGWELEAGVRRLMVPVVLPQTAFDVFVAGRASPAIGRWRPAVGVELGLTGAFRYDWAAILEERAAYSPAPETSESSPLYLSVQAEPLRFRVGRITAEVGALSVGSTLPRWGRLARVELGWLHVAVAL